MNATWRNATWVNITNATEPEPEPEPVTGRRLQEAEGRVLQQAVRDYTGHRRRMQAATCSPLSPTEALYGPGAVSGTCDQIGFLANMCVLACRSGYEVRTARQRLPFSSLKVPLLLL